MVAVAIPKILFVHRRSTRQLKRTKVVFLSVGPFAKLATNRNTSIRRLLAPPR